MNEPTVSEEDCMHKGSIWCRTPRFLRVNFRKRATNREKEEHMMKQVAMKLFVVFVVSLGTALLMSLFCWASTLSASPLSITTVSAPDINCKFDTDCKVFVNDFADHFALPGTTGDAFLQSRSFPQGEPLTEGENLFAYLYRIDLRQLAGIVDVPCIFEFEVDWVGPVIPLDYDDDLLLEDVFVVTVGGLGTVAPVAADKTWNKVTFTFNPQVCAGAFEGDGESTFFFGLASSTPPQFVQAHLRDTLDGVTVIQARSPGIATISKIKELIEFIQSLNSSDFSNKIYQDVLIRKTKIVEGRVDRGADNLCTAVNKLANDILPKTDGEPRPKDWVSNRAAQMQIEDMTIDILRSIQSQADGLRGCR